MAAYLVALCALLAVAPLAAPQSMPENFDQIQKLLSSDTLGLKIQNFNLDGKLKVDQDDKNVGGNQLFSLQAMQPGQNIKQDGTSGIMHNLLMDITNFNGASMAVKPSNSKLFTAVYVGKGEVDLTQKGTNTELNQAIFGAASAPPQSTLPSNGPPQSTVGSNPIIPGIAVGRTPPSGSSLKHPIGDDSLDSPPVRSLPSRVPPSIRHTPLGTAPPLAGRRLLAN